MKRLENKVCLVTGGSMGIGEQTARLFAREGATVIVGDIADKKGQTLADEIGASYHHHDVSMEQSWRALIDQIKSDHQRLDVLVNNAATFTPNGIEQMELSAWQRTLDVNLTGVMLGCREAIGLMKNNPGGPKGSIVNLSSIAGYVGLAGAAAYSAAKGGVRLLTKSIAVHCAREYKLIRCNSVHPGAIDTPMNETSFQASGEPETMRAHMEQVQPIGRMIDPLEIANGILFLASDDSSAMTGSELLIDGAWLATPSGL